MKATGVLNDFDRLVEESTGAPLHAERIRIIHLRRLSRVCRISERRPMTRKAEFRFH